MPRGTALLVVVVVSVLSRAAAGSSDGVTLSVNKGPGADDVTLTWAGGQPLFQVYRSTLPGDVATPGRQIAETTGSSSSDATPPGGSIYFYQVREYCPNGSCPLAEVPEPARAEPCERCSGCDRGAEPTNSTYLFSGEFHFSAIDLRIKGRGLDFVWARKYRSRSGPLSAMGHGWDYSYNLRVELSGPNVLLHDGNTRSDLYLAQPDGTWARQEFFRVLGQQLDGSFRLTFADTGQWNFKPLDGSPAAGKISTIVDRNGNALSFAYDGVGRLSSITDTFGRQVTLQYNPSGFIESVTDFAGRQVRYAYYQDGDSGGSFGDLKSMTTPAVVGTPHNDFPAGKTTLYTYSQGSSEPQLDHNLLTITDPKGQTYLQNTYDPTTNPLDPDFDHLRRQVWGDPGDIIDVVYVRQAPDATNGFARNKAIVNDRLGNVREYLYDSRNRLVIKREYTGRANPDLPTTDLDNRPTGKLRPTDPNYFETRWAYNADSLPTSITRPNLDSTVKTYEFDLDPSAPRRSRGNLRQVTRNPGPLGGDQTSITDSYTYQTGFGGCSCGTNFVTSHVDARGNVTQHGYDGRGNRLHTQHRIPSVVENWEYNAFGQLTAHDLPDNGGGSRRRDTYAYYGPADGIQNGHLRLETRDSAGFSLATTYVYDAAGSVVRKIDGRGNDTLFFRNALDQVVRQTSREASPGSGIRYGRVFYYDANDRLVRVDIENRDEQGVLQPNAYFTRTYDYDILDRVVRETAEVDPARSIVTEIAYDANRNPALLRYGMATNGADPANVVAFRFDERDLLFRETRGEGSASAATRQIDYDGNGNVRTEREGIESAPRINVYGYDGYDRRVSAKDPMGNVVEFHWDPNGSLGGDRSPGIPNPFGERMLGEITDVSGSGGNTRLAQVQYVYDAMDRRIRSTYDHFDPQTQAPIGDGFSITQWTYSDDSQVLATTDDNGRTTGTTYDTANRRLTVTDPRGNTTTYGYDSNSNGTTVQEVDRSDLGNPDRMFVTTFSYDGLDRLVQKVDNAGNTTVYAYDSRSNKVSSRDARGNVIRYAFDGIGRALQTAQDLTDTGDGNGQVIGTIFTLRSWDDSSRLSSQTDDNGNATVYVYDALNRRIRTVFADGTTDNLSHDVHDNVTTRTDANGSVVTTTYDLDDRLAGRTIAPGPGVSPDTTAETYQYDGASRLVRAQDNDSLLTRAYDSLSNVLRETQRILPAGPVRTFTSTYDGVANLLRLSYPGGRAIVSTYDALDRPSLVRDDPPGAEPMLATYRYVGARRVERRDLGNGTRLDSSYDGLRRTVETRHSRIATGTLIDDRFYSFDAIGNKIFMNSTLSVPPENRAYSYDSVNRLVRSQVLPSGSLIDYLLDDVGNRLLTTGPGGGPYSMDPTMSSPGDFQMNQYTVTPLGSMQYDANGNRIGGGGGTQQYQHDYANRLVRFTDTGTGQLTSYRYDCLGRRIEKSVAGSVARYYSFGWQELEEQDTSNFTVSTFVFGRRANELLQMNRLGVKYYFHADDLGSTMKVTDAAAGLLESYQYADYGHPSFFNSSGFPISGTQVHNDRLFTGSRFDPESHLYYARTRYEDPLAGRYVSRDTRGVWADPADLGNAATYASNNPTTLMQTFGGKYQCLHSFIHPPSCRTLDCEFDCQLIQHSGFDWSRKPQNFNYWTCVCPTEMIGGAMTERELDNYTLNSLLLDLAEAVSRVCWSFPPTNLNLVFEVLNEIAKTQKHLSDLDK